MTDVAEYTTLKVAELRELVVANEVEVPKRATKVQLIEALVAADAQAASPLESLLAQRAEALSPGVKAALTKQINALGGTVPGQTTKLTPEMLTEGRQDGDTIPVILERLGFEVNAARKARVAFLVNRGEVEEFAS